jgi:hypothetical protein
LTKYFETGEIKFSNLQAELGDITPNSSDIKISNYKRNIQSNVDWDDPNTFPKIPDATENEGVSATNSNLRLSGYRGIIKEYKLTQNVNTTDSNVNWQTGIEDRKTINDWNRNLSKNVAKRLLVNGTIYSTSTSTAALDIRGNLSNLTIDIGSTGKLYGEGGSWGARGGDALYINDTDNTTPVKIILRNGGQLWAGGGGGSYGGSGNPGGRLTCYNYHVSGYYNNVNYKKGTRTLAQGDPNGSCARYFRGGNWAGGYNVVNNRPRCRGSRDALGPYRSGHRSYVCSDELAFNCNYTQTSYAGGGSGGSGGGGSVGQGYSNPNTPSPGGYGNPGTMRCCSGPGGCSVGNPGSPGYAGGTWGQSGGGPWGGAAGWAIRWGGVEPNRQTFGSQSIKGPQGYG